MSRTRAESRCCDCNEVPKDDGSGRLTCACNKTWQRCLGQPGTEEEETLLASKGFKMARDCQGDVYYIGQEGQIIWLYGDSEWSGSAAPPGCSSLEEYFDWLEQQRARL